jgi:hypothetical protein
METDLGGLLSPEEIKEAWALATQKIFAAEALLLRARLDLLEAGLATDHPVTKAIDTEVSSVNRMGQWVRTRL